MKVESFQKRTNVRQSIELRSLGACQDLRSAADLVWVCPAGFDASKDKSWAGHFRPSDLDLLNWDVAGSTTVRAFTLQEMIHELMESHSVSIDVLSGETEVALWRKDRMKPGDPEEYAHPICPVFSSGQDPFQAVYNAFCWLLKKAKEAA